MSSPLLLPNGQRAKNPKLTVNADGTIRVNSLMTPDEWAALEHKIQSKFNLFRNDGGRDYGERAICRKVLPDGSVMGCGAKHTVFTLRCIERPFRGLEEGLWYAMRSTSATPGLKAQISRTMARLPDIASGHPRLAATLEPDGEGEDWYGVLLSLPQPISAKEALTLQRRINDKHPPIPLELFTPAEIVLVDAGVAL